MALALLWLSVRAECRRQADTTDCTVCVERDLQKDHKTCTLVYCRGGRGVCEALLGSLEDCFAFLSIR